jgi:membrane associated rhomboid family serine protease
MTDVMFISVWLISGWLGSALVWWIHKSEFSPWQKCPTPKAILAGFCGGLLGVIIFSAAVIVWVLDVLMSTKRHDNWFNTPICGPKDGYGDE